MRYHTILLKPFSKKMREQLVEICKKTHVSDFSTLLINDMKTKKKTQICFLGMKISTIAKSQPYLDNRLKGLQLY